MKKKVMIMLLAATMIGSSVPAGVMAADVTDFAGEEVVEERNETEVLGDSTSEFPENMLTPSPSETPTPGEEAFPEPTVTPVPREPEPTEIPEPEMPEPTVAPTPSDDFTDGSVASERGTGEVGVPKYKCQ